MTNITAIKKGNNITLTATGHATGNNDCCVSISAVLNSLVGWIDNARLDPSIHIEVIREDVAPGKVRLNVNGDDAVMTAFEMAIIGLKRISVTCPKYCECHYYTA